MNNNLRLKILFRSIGIYNKYLVNDICNLYYITGCSGQ